MRTSVWFLNTVGIKITILISMSAEKLESKYNTDGVSSSPLFFQKKIQMNIWKICRNLYHKINWIIKEKKLILKIRDHWNLFITSHEILTSLLGLFHTKIQRVQWWLLPCANPFICVRVALRRHWLIFPQRCQSHICAESARHGIVHWCVWHWRGGGGVLKLVNDR